MTLAEIPQCRSAKFPAAEAMVMLVSKEMFLFT